MNFSIINKMADNHIQMTLGKTGAIKLKCYICKIAEVNTVLLPCTHLVTCTPCGKKLDACPICKREVQFTWVPILMRDEPCNY